MNALRRLRAGKAGEREGVAAARSRPGGSARWLAMVIAALLSLAVQSVVAQTHLHLRPRSAPSQSQQSIDAARPPHHRAHGAEPLDCPGCRQLARAASVLLPDIFSLTIVAAGAIGWFALAAAGPRCRAQRSHCWRSRAPPPAIAASSA